MSEILLEVTSILHFILGNKEEPKLPEQASNAIIDTLIYSSIPNIRIINEFSEMIDSSSWHVRKRALLHLRVCFLCKFFIFSKSETELVFQLVVKCLVDPQLEVIVFINVR